LRERLWNLPSYGEQINTPSLEALLAVLDKDHALIIFRTGDVSNLNDGIVAVGSVEVMHWQQHACLSNTQN